MVGNCDINKYEQLWKQRVKEKRNFDLDLDIYNKHKIKPNHILAPEFDSTVYKNEGNHIVDIPFFQSKKYSQAEYMVVAFSFGIRIRSVSEYISSFFAESNFQGPSYILEVPYELDKIIKTKRVRNFKTLREAKIEVAYIIRKNVEAYTYKREFNHGCNH